MKRVVILQSNYIPWKGYFDLIHDADLFIFFDDRQFTKRDWRTRNKIKTLRGAEWITIPVGGNTERLICEVEIKDDYWQQKHWKTIKQQYEKSPYFSIYRPFFEEIYLAKRWTNLSEMNQHIISSISRDLLGLTTEFVDSRLYQAEGHKMERLLDLVAKTNATHYISGPAAKEYILPERFVSMGVELIWKDYSNYPAYPQLYPPFEHGVSILDLLFNVGPKAGEYIWGWRK
jgi:hypothetical protein